MLAVYGSSTSGVEVIRSEKVCKYSSTAKLALLRAVHMQPVMRWSTSYLAIASDRVRALKLSALIRVARGYPPMLAVELTRGTLEVL